MQLVQANFNKLQLKAFLSQKKYVHDYFRSIFVFNAFKPFLSQKKHIHDYFRSIFVFNAFKPFLSQMKHIHNYLRSIFVFNAFCNRKESENDFSQNSVTFKRPLSPRRIALTLYHAHAVIILSSGCTDIVSRSYRNNTQFRISEIPISKSYTASSGFFRLVSLWFPGHSQVQNSIR